MEKLTVSVRMHIKLEDIENLLYSTVTGSRYWCGNIGELGYERNVKQVLGGEKDYILFDDEEDHVSHFLNLKKIKKGLAVMAKKETSHFADFIQENADENTADVFLQCCLFGKVIYS